MSFWDHLNELRGVLFRSSLSLVVAIGVVGSFVMGDYFAALIAAEDADYAWATGSERDPCMLCYTSGTTGNPKGVLYEHRSTVLHAMLASSPAVLGLSSADVLLPVVPLFHAAAWGTPFAAPMAGTKLVFSAVNDPKVLCGLMNEERVTISSGVPTVWLAMFAYADATGESPRHLRMATIGGSAAPRAMIARLMRLFMRRGVVVPEPDRIWIAEAQARDGDDATDMAPANGPSAPPLLNQA